MKNNHKIMDYLEKHKDEMDKTSIIMICQLVIFTNFNYEHLKKLLKGAYFIIHDDGEFYNKWKRFKNNNKYYFKHSSSHQSCKKQQRIGKNKICNINGQINHNYDCIIGTVCCKSDISNHEDCNTWFQFEKTRINNISNTLKHSVDYLHYLISNKNIGPFGKSHHTQDNPVHLKLK